MVGNKATVPDTTPNNSLSTPKTQNRKLTNLASLLEKSPVYCGLGHPNFSPITPNSQEPENN